MLKMQKGFSLVELMVVVAIIAIIGVIAVPTIVTTLPGYTLKNAAREVCSNMRKARSLAIKQNTNVMVVFYPGNNTYRYGTMTVKLDRGVVFGAGDAASGPGGAALPGTGIGFTNNTITFTGRGIVPNWTSQFVYIHNNRGLTYAVGASAAGNIDMWRWEGGTWDNQ